MIKWIFRVTRKPPSPWRPKATAGRRRQRTTVSKKDYELLKESARVLVHERLEFFNTHYKFAYKKVFIKNTTTRWGSCSSHGNLNFNYKIIKLPPELADYLIVHEMCHLREMNHGPRFWSLVSETIPNYEFVNKQLKKIPLSS